MSTKNNKKVVDRIPLKVKKPVSHKKPKIELPVLKEDKTSLQVLSTVKVICVLVLLAVSMNLIINIVLEIDKNKAVEVVDDNKPIEDASNILGSWLTDNNSLFVFEKDGNFYWYDYYEEKNNNYYNGTFTYKTGLDALEEMGYTEEDLALSFDEDVKIENVYSIIIKPTTVIKGRKDVTNKEISENETWWFLIIKKEDGTALGYNKTLDIRYNLKAK
jgi:hypothetical protein